MPIDSFASAPHYTSHIINVWKALPDEMRGTFYVGSGFFDQIEKYNIPFTHSAVPRSANPIIVASYGDYRATGRRQVVFVEHGSGQRYVDAPNHPAYAGGRGRERVILFICPSETVAQRNRDRYPHTPAVAVGCPRLDPLHAAAEPLHDLRPRSSPPLVAITFHADYSIVPETQSSYRFFYSAIPLLQQAGYQVLGHAHPRLYRRIARLYDRHGILHTADADHVLGHSDVLCADNTSLAFEASSLGIQIVWMSPPFYRRDIHHGLRFWQSLVLGPEARTPEQVPAAVSQALAPIPSDLYHQRQDFLDTVYAYRDGKAGARAAEAIVRVVDGSPS